jgi:predicted nucleic acid-binding protein
LILIDSSVLVAYGREEDSDHKRALTLMDKIGSGIYGEAIVNDYIFSEVITTILNKSKSLTRAIAIGEVIESSMELKEVGRINFGLAWQFFKMQKDTKLSFTDCTIICMTQTENIDNVAAFDKEFKKVEGINVIDS